MKWLKNKYFVFAVTLTAFLLDRLLKTMVLKKEGFFIIPDFLKINYYPNQGISFSLPVSPIIVYPLVILILVVVFYFFAKGLKQKEYFLVWGSALIFTGAFSNLLDRFRFGQVVDYFNFPGHFPVFNLADVMIAAGAGLIILKGIRKNKKRVPRNGTQ